MSILLPEKLPDSVDKAIANITEKPTNEIGEIFNDLIYLVFGGLHSTAEKMRIKRDYAIKEYEKICKEKYENIPLENRVEPNTQIICQALEDSKYCVENEDIREMFANLIASTMDSRTYKTVHPSFSEKLKQMTPQDAKFFKNFIGDKTLPICNFNLKYKEGSYITLFNYVYIKSENDSLEEAESNSLVLSTLESLGIICTDFINPLANGNLYLIYENSDIFKMYKEQYETDAIEVGIKVGSAELTVLGKNLLTICCP